MLTTPVSLLEPITRLLASTPAINSEALWTSAILRPSPTHIQTQTQTSKIPTKGISIQAQMDPRSLNSNFRIRMMALNWIRKPLASRIFKTMPNAGKMNKRTDKMSQKISRLCNKRWKMLRHRKWDTKTIKTCLDLGNMRSNNLILINLPGNLKNLIKLTERDLKNSKMFRRLIPKK